jgi:tetratricopeptide (TPR) repeat protein
MGKHKYSEVKHPDKFAETLDKVWQKAQPYVLPIGILMAIALVLAIGWLILSRHFGGRTDRQWAGLFEASKGLTAESDDPLEPVNEKALGKLAAFANQFRAQPAAALALWEVAQEEFRLADARRDEDADAAKKHLEKAAEAAERFIADFPNHPYVAFAQYEAGKARLELGDPERAAKHFKQAREAKLRYPAVLAQWHEAFCYEQLGRLDEARRIYESLRDDQTAGWCAMQAEFQLAQLGRAPAKGPQRESASPAPPPAAPAPPK